MTYTNLKVAAASAATAAVAVPVAAVSFIRQVQGSVGVAPPTTSMKTEEDPSQCALFRHLPNLSDKVAWRSLGMEGPTPIHRCTVTTPLSKTGGNTRVELLVKREDLSSQRYGGNKVRTLQHQLAVCEARREGGEPAFKQLVSYGTGGSNQVVATVVHAEKLGWNGKNGANVNAYWGDKDEPDLDNTLNMLSVLSFPQLGWTHSWGDSIGPRRFIAAIVGAVRQTDFVPMMPGGNCPVGVLGQVGAIIELAEQIASGDCPNDPGRIYLPVGSACTISGLVVGVVLARRLGLPAFADPDFKIVGCEVHEGLAFLQEKVGFHTNPLFSAIPFSITNSVKVTCAMLRDIGGPDLEEDALEFVRTSVDMRADADLVGTYGAHSDVSRPAAKAFDETGVIVDVATGEGAKPLWLCGHFAAKAFAPLLDDLEDQQKDAKDGKTEGKTPAPYLLWMTKSAVQPRGDADEWTALLGQSDAVLEWADEGKAESVLRQGHVSTTDGKPDDYRTLMTKIE